MQRHGPSGFVWYQELKASSDDVAGSATLARRHGYGYQRSAAAENTEAATWIQWNMHHWQGQPDVGMIAY